MATVTVHEAKTHLSKLIARALDGEDVVIAKGVEPKVRLVPVDPKPDRVSGRWKGRIAIDDRFFDPLPQEDIDAWGF